jgi:hypothetical protein
MNTPVIEPAPITGPDSGAPRPQTLPVTAIQWWAAGRNIISALLGALAMFGLLKQVDITTAMQALDSIADAVGKIALALGVLVPLVTAAFASRRASDGGQVQAVKAMPVASKTAVAETLPPAVKAELAAGAPGVGLVVAAPEIAAAAPSDKVVDPLKARRIIEKTETL